MDPKFRELPTLKSLSSMWEGAPKSLVRKVMGCVEDVGSRVDPTEVALIIVEAKDFHEWRFNAGYLRETPSFERAVSPAMLTCLARRCNDIPQEDDGPLMTRFMVTWLRQHGLHDMLQAGQAGECMPFVLCAVHRERGWTMVGYLHREAERSTTRLERVLH